MTARPRRLRRLGVRAALTLLTALLCVPVAASAAPASPSGPAPASNTVSFGVVPSTAKGPDGRSTFTYTDLKPLTVLHDYVGITNYSEKSVKFTVYATDGYVTSHGGLDLLPADRKPTDIGTWVKLAHDSVTVPPHARVNEPFTLTVPANATPGDHTGGVLASVLRAGNEIKVDQRVGVPIYLRVAGALTPQLQIESTTTRFHGSLNPFSGGSAQVSYTVHNTGNVRLTGTQTVTVRGPLGVTDATVHPDRLLQVLPGSSVRMTVNVPGVYPAGPLSVAIKIDPVPVNGLKTVTGPAVPAVKRSVGLWATPWALVGLIVLIVTGSYGARWWRRRSAPAPEPQPEVVELNTPVRA